MGTTCPQCSCGWSSPGRGIRVVRKRVLPNTCRAGAGSSAPCAAPCSAPGGSAAGRIGASCITGCGCGSGGGGRGRGRASLEHSRGTGASSFGAAGLSRAVLLGAGGGPSPDALTSSGAGFFAFRHAPFADGAVYASYMPGPGTSMLSFATSNAVCCLPDDFMITFGTLFRGGSGLSAPESTAGWSMPRGSETQIPSASTYPCVSLLGMDGGCAFLTQCTAVFSRKAVPPGFNSGALGKRRLDGISVAK
ncbi:hypothetical protein DIPPA_05918 [Diplonema papillatum]|nr:hypothetical protein DIPPA_05918 [Diplonema papillatum]